MNKRKIYLGVGLLGLAILVGLAIRPDQPTAPATKSTGQRTAFSPINGGGGAVQTSFAGVVDPTNPQFAGGLTSCVSSCTGVADRNRAAIQSAIAAAAANNYKIYIPPPPLGAAYPIGRASGQAYAIDFGGVSNITIEGYGATLRATGNAGGTDFNLFYVRNTAHVKLIGLTFSQRDMTSATTDSNAVLVGDGGSTNTDDVQILDCNFVEGVGGDYVRMDGGASAVTVTRVRVGQSSRFEGGARAGVDIRPGVQRVTITYDWFLGNANRDVWVEAGANNIVGQVIINGNHFDRTGSTTIQSVTIAGYGTSNQADQVTVSRNRVLGGVIDGSAVSRLLIYQNTIQMTTALGATANIDLAGYATDVWIAENHILRGTSANAGPLVHVGESSSAQPHDVQILRNRGYQYTTGNGIDVTGTARYWVEDNDLTYHNSTADSGTSGFVGVYCNPTYQACSGQVTRNRIREDDQPIVASLDLGTVTTHDNTVIQATYSGTGGNNITIAFVGDSGSTAGSRSESGQAITIHYRPAFTTVAGVETLINASQQIGVKTTGTGSNVLQVGDAFSATHLAGALRAGRMLAGVELLKGTPATVGATWLRDNTIDGARDLLYSDATGSAVWTEGYPVLSGNQLLGVANFVEGGILTYETESSPDAETVTTGATSVSKKMTFITTANTQAYTQADGIVDGQRHCFKVKSTSGTPAGTWTPAHLADGTSHTITWSAAGGAWCVSWDATSTTYRLLSITSGATLN